MRVVDEECAARRAPSATTTSSSSAGWTTATTCAALADAINRGVVVDTCEVAARWSVLPALYRDAVAAIKAVPGTLVASAHQSHAYPDGACLYFTFAGQREGDGGAERSTPTRGRRSPPTLAAGGALSHHHGVGLNRGRFMAEALGAAFPTLAGVKPTLDPNGILNPGKLGLAVAVRSGVAVAVPMASA